MFIGNKTEEALRHIPWIPFSTVDQFPSEESYFKEMEQDIRQEKFPEVTKMSQRTKSKQVQNHDLHGKRSCLVLVRARDLTPYHLAEDGKPGDHSHSHFFPIMCLNTDSCIPSKKVKIPGLCEPMVASIKCGIGTV